MEPRVSTAGTGAIRALLELGELRVWSVVITIFGDLARAPGQRIAASDLRRLTRPMNIRDDSLRVAVHRLKKDGWLRAQRVGRNSLYFLTTRGFRDCHQARARIYAQGPPGVDEMRVVVAANGGAAAQALAARGFVQIAPRCYLGAADNLPPDPACLVLHPQPSHVPSWVRHALAPPGVGACYQRLLDALETVERATRRAGHLAPDSQAALRVLVVHRWRQVLLRHADLPAAFLPDDWRTEACRALVLRLLERLPRPEGIVSGATLP